MDGGAVLQLTVIAVALLALVGVVAWHVVDTMWSRRLMVRREVLVQLRSGSAVKGALWARKGRTLVLKSATLLEPGAEAVSMDGDVVLDRDVVDWVQVAG
jgi:hypothetical protein